MPTANTFPAALAALHLLACAGALAQARPDKPTPSIKEASIVTRWNSGFTAPDCTENRMAFWMGSWAQKEP